MSCRHTLYNAGPGILDIQNLVPGDDFHFTLTIDHDISASTFDAAVISSRDRVLLASFTISGVATVPSGILDVSLSSDDTELITEDALWYFNETNAGFKKTLLAGSVGIYNYD